tara:strand:+ start:654 stop:884 length:231 start_codon:yes stop_codon:yes gene_type:complete
MFSGMILIINIIQVILLALIVCFQVYSRYFHKPVFNIIQSKSDRQNGNQTVHVVEQDKKQPVKPYDKEEEDIWNDM